MFCLQLCLPSHWNRQDPIYQTFLWNNYLWFQKSQEFLGLLTRHWILNYNGDPWVQLRRGLAFSWHHNVFFSMFWTASTKILLQILAAYKTKALIWLSALPYSRAAGWLLRSCAQITSVHHHPGPPGRCCSSGSSSEPLYLLRSLLYASVWGGREGVNVCFIRSPHKRRQCGKHLWEKHRTINCTTYRVTVQHEHGAHLSKLPVLLNNELTAAAIHSALTNFQFSLRLQLTELHGIHFLKFLPGFTALSFLPLLLVCLWWWNLIHCHYLSIWWNQSGQAPTKSPA